MRHNRGQQIIEYILLIAAVAVVCIIFLSPRPGAPMYTAVNTALWGIVNDINNNPLNVRSTTPPPSPPPSCVPGICPAASTTSCGRDTCGNSNASCGCSNGYQCLGTMCQCSRGIACGNNCCASGQECFNNACCSPVTCRGSCLGEIDNGCGRTILCASSSSCQRGQMCCPDALDRWACRPRGTCS